MYLSSKKAQSGFTLVELLIVVIILAILAAIVVPQFASSTEDAKVSGLDTSLANMRSAIDLYYQQHGHYPSAVAADGGTCPDGTAGTGIVNSEAAFLDQMAYYTNADGQACSTKSNGTDSNAYPFGPYLKKRAMPENPILGTSTLTVVNTGNLVMAGADAGAWRFDNVVGKFIADDATHTDPDNKTYDTH